MDVDNVAPPPRKKLRSSLANGPKPSKQTPPRLFAPFRALGFVTSHVPFAVQTRSTKGSTSGPRIHIVTCLGRAWALWEGEKMGLLFVGSDLDGPISSLLMDGDAVWAASGSSVHKFLRGKPVSHLTNPLETSLATITVFGSQMLALTEDGRHLLVWDMPSGELRNTISFDAGFTATIMLHPATYLNKILVGSSQGTMQLWNISTGTCIHRFAASSLHDSSSSLESDDNTSTSTPHVITCLVQSPAVDVVGIGFSSGEVSVYDIRADERLIRVHMQGGEVRAIGFRSDGEPILATASSTGNVALWDLNAGGRLLHVIRGAHDGAVTAVQWIPGQPLLLTSGDDNSVKQWLFDSPTAAPRLLKFRSGHQNPPHYIRYYAEDGKQLLTASRDRSLRCTSVVRDSRSFELSQGSLSKKAATLSLPLSHFKFPPITSLAFSSTRSKDWDDVVTSHTGESFARTWTVLNKKVGKWAVEVPAPSVAKSKKKGKVGTVRTVFVTACGNFGLAGSTTGDIQMWNMQSGMKRKAYSVGPAPEEVARRKGGSGTERPVTGLATDGLNKVVIACTLDGTVNFFDFHSTKLEETLVLPACAVSLLMHADSGLIAVVCDDLVVRLVDLETRRIVREMKGFRGRILDVAFSPDSRWLITTSLDSVIRTFDVPTGRLIDAFKTSSVATSLTFSPTGDFLATAHVDSVGVYLWANRAQYAEVSLQTFVEDGNATSVSLPSVQGLAEDEALDGLSALALDSNNDVYTTPEQLDEELVTLTLLPRSRWQTLLNLETITQRNKPKEAPKAPEKAPFFLPTLPGVDHRFAVEPTSSTNDDGKASKRLGKGVDLESEFHRKLMEADEDSDYNSLFTYLKALSPAAIDLELRSLSTTAAFSAFLHALIGRLKTHRDFEAVQTFMAVFLRLHGDVIVQNSDGEGLVETMRELEEVQKEESVRILSLISMSLGTLGFVRDTV